MAINKKLIHFEKRDNFDTRLANNEINDTSIVFIQDTGELWTHGLFFCTTATNLLEAPSLLTVGDTIAVQIGDKTSNYIVPPAALKGRTMYECVTDTTNTRGHWTGTIPGVTELYDGLVIHVRFTTTYYGNGEGYNTLNINNLGHKLVWWRYGSILTTHWGTNAELTLTYRTNAGSYKVSNANGELTNGTTYTDGWVADYAYYTDGNYLSGSYYYRYKVNTNGYIGRYMIVMRCPDGTITGLTTTNNSTATTKTMFSGPLLLDDIHYYASTNTYAANSVFAHDGGNMRDNYSLIDVRYTFNCGSTLVANKPFFIVGNIGDDGCFYLDLTQPWALDYPTTEDNKLYILIGPCYDTYRVNLELFKPIYIFKNGKIQLYSQYASETEWDNITGKPSTFTPSAHDHDDRYLLLAGGTMTGSLKWTDANALPQATSTNYFVTIDGFADGGTTKWISKANALTSLTGLTSSAKGSITTPIYWTGSAFSTVLATFGSRDYGEHNANNIKSNGLWYYTSNGPTTTLGASTADGALYSQAYNTSYVAQIAQDYRNGNLFTRGLNNGTWSTWRKVWNDGNDGTGSGLDADLLDGKHASEFVPYVGSVGSAVYNINSLLNWTGVEITLPWTYDPHVAVMFAFTIRLYNSYAYTDIVISGYNYGNNHWHAPTAEIIGGSKTYTVKFGWHDDPKKLYVWIGLGKDSNNNIIKLGYGGLSIINVHVGHTSVNAYTNWSHAQKSEDELVNVQSTLIPKLNYDWDKIINKPSLSLSTHTHAWNSLTRTSTTAGQVIVSTNTANGWELKTLGSNAFDSTGYVKLSDTEQTIESTISSYSKGIVEFYRSSGDHIAFILFANKVNNAKRVLGSIGFYSGGVGKLQYRSPSAEYYDLVHGGNVSTYVQGSTITLSTTALTFLTVKTGLSGSLSSTTTTIKLPATDPYTSARTPTSHTHYATRFNDSRNDDMTPTIAAAVNGVAIDFKTNANGVNAGTGSFCGLVTFDPYSDVSGGYPLQMGFNSGLDANNTNLLYIRTVKDANTWNSWRTILTSSNIGSYALKLTGGTLTGAVDISTSSSAVDTTKGINFTYSTTTGHIGLATLLGIYSSGNIAIRPNGGSSAGLGLDISSTSFKYNNTNVSLEGHTHSLYVTSVGVTDDTTNHANLLRYVKNGTSTYFTVPFATNSTNATSATTADNLNKSTLGYLYQSATTTTGSTGTVTATSGKIGVPIQFYGSQVNYALNNDLFYATVASNAITANTIYLGDAIKSKTFVKTSTHVPTGASSGSSSSSGSGESITYTAGDGIKITGTLISTNTWTGTESLFAELSNPGSYDLIYIIED